MEAAYQPVELTKYESTDRITLKTYLVKISNIFADVIYGLSLAVRGQPPVGAGARHPRPGEEAEAVAASVGVGAGVAAGVPVQPEDVEVTQVEEGVPLEVGVHQLHLAAGEVGVHPERQFDTFLFIKVAFPADKEIYSVRFVYLID